MTDVVDDGISREIDRERETFILDARPHFINSKLLFHGRSTVFASHNYSVKTGRCHFNTWSCFFRHCKYHRLLGESKSMLLTLLRITKSRAVFSYPRLLGPLTARALLVALVSRGVGGRISKIWAHYSLAWTIDRE